MDFTLVISLLKNASLYDLYRLQVALKNQMEDPEEIHQARNAFAVGDTVSYFNAKTNSLSQGLVLEKNLKNLVIKDHLDHRDWSLPYCMINLSGKDSDIKTQGREKLSKNNLKVGDLVGFDYEGKNYSGVVSKLNFKTVSLSTRDSKNYRVPYGMLFKIMEGECEQSVQGDWVLIEGDSARI